MPPAPELAKLARPRLYRVTARERLFRALDGLREDETMRATLDKGFEQLAVQVSALTETVSARRYAIG
jgi:hypothetical protein